MDNYFYFEGKKIPVSDETAKNIVSAIKPVFYRIGDRFDYYGNEYILAEASIDWELNEAILVNSDTGIAYHWRKTVKDRFEITEEEFKTITNGRKFTKI